MGSHELDEWLTVLASGDDGSRETAAQALGRLGSAAVEPLALALEGKDADARWWAARALAEVGGKAAVPPLLRALTDSDPDVRACAALALGHAGEESAASHLVAHLTDESAFVASIAADALSMLGEAAVPALVEALNDEQPRGRLLAVRALDRIRSEKAVVPLAGMLEDPSYLVRYCALEALDNLGVGMTYFQP